MPRTTHPAAVTLLVAEEARSHLEFEAVVRLQTVGRGDDNGVLLVANEGSRAVYSWRIAEEGVVEFDHEAEGLSAEEAEEEFLRRIEGAVISSRRKGQ